MRHVLLAGGGTGGHVFPGLALAEELERRRCRVSWLGRPAGMERDLVERRGLEYLALPSRAVLGRGAAAQLGALATTAVSAFKARGLIRRHGVDSVLGTGGYVSAPGVIGGRLAGKRVFLFEPNLRAGAANRWLSRLATGVCLGYAETAAEVGGRSIHTGIPVRSEFFEGGDLRPGHPRVLVLGGSQGAQQINRLMPQALERLSASSAGTLTLSVLHQTGSAHEAVVRDDYASRSLAGIDVEVIPFIGDVAAEMASAHIVVSRAGALTLAELCAAGRASILVPLAIAAGHQGDNAERLRAAGAAEILSSAGAEEMERLLVSLLEDRSRLQKMAVAARSLARPDAASRIADLLEGSLERWEEER